MPDSRSRKYGVRKRGKKWVARPYVGGEHHWVGTFETEGEALREAMRVHDELKRLPANKETISSFVDRWLTDYPRPEKSTNDHYARHADLFAELHGSKRPREFSRLEARRFAREHPGAARSIRSMFSDMTDEGLVEVNQFFGLKSINSGGEQGRKKIVVITSEELSTLIEIAKDVHSNYDFWQIVQVAAEVGYRPSEAWGLERCDFDLPADEIAVRRQIYRGRITTPKNHEPRRIILTPSAKAAYETLPRYTPIVRVDERGIKRPMDFAFRNKSGDPMSASTLHHYWESVRTVFEAGLSRERRDEFRAPRDPEHPSMDFYELRHFCATQLLEMFRADGQDGAADVAIQLGHTDEGDLVRRLYGHPDDQLSRERLKRLFNQPAELRPVEDEDEAANG